MHEGVQIVVDRTRCEANGRCVRQAPQVFSLDDDDELHVASAQVPTLDRALLARAVASCPRAALSLLDNDRTSALDGKQ